MVIESFSFDQGINRKKSTLLLGDGEMYSCSGFSFEKDGILEPRPSLSQYGLIDSTSTSIINGIHAYGSSVYGSSKTWCPGNQSQFNYIYYRTVGGAYSYVDWLYGNSRPRFGDYEDFTFMVDGLTRKAFYQGNFYIWGVDQPQQAPVVLDSGGGSGPSGTYNCCFTYYITFPNGKVVETPPSSVVSVTLTDNAINWSNISSCPYSGSGLIIYRKLYRSVSGIYYLAKTIQNNTTTTYTDSFTDAQLQINSILSTDSYQLPPENAVDITVYLQRVFLVKGKYLYWSEPYMPFSFVNTSNAVITKENEDLVGIIQWGDQLWMVSAEQWYRLTGTDPSSWSISRTSTDVGIINRNTLVRSKYGLIGLWSDGIYLFDGNVNRNITEKKLGRSFFTSLSDLSVCYAEFDGTKYYFYYASSGTTIDSCIIIDFTYYPDYRVYERDFIADAHEVYFDNNHAYLAKNGYEYEESGTEPWRPISLITGDKVLGGVLKRKVPEYLYYDINTNNNDVFVDILVDGTASQRLIIKNSSRERKRSDKLKMIEGYRLGLQISSADFTGGSIYSPWGLEATPVGD